MFRTAVSSVALTAMCGLAACTGKSDNTPIVPPPRPIDARPGLPVPGSLAQLELVSGAVSVEHQGVTAPAKLQALYGGDAVETGEQGAARVVFAAGRVVELSADSRFVLSEGESGGLILNLARGLVISRVAHEPGQPAPPGQAVELTILTPFGLTRVGSAEVQLNVNEKETQVEVTMGAVEMVSRSGEVSRVNAGQKVALLRELPVLEVVVRSSGKTEVRHADKTSQVVGAGKTASLRNGDVLRVKDGRSVMEFDGDRLSGGAGTELSVRELGRGSDGAATLKLTLLKGELTANLARDKKRVVDLDDVRLASTDSGQFTIVKTKDGYLLNTITGTINVISKEGTPTEVTAGHAARLAKGAVEQRAFEREALQLPTQMGLKVFHPGLKAASLVWGGDAERYLVEVSSDPSFTALLARGEVAQRYLNVSIPSRGNLYWRVFAAGAEVDRGSAFFSPESSTGDLDRNLNDVKDGVEKTTIFFQDKPPVVTFRWQEKENAVSYRLQVFRDGQLGKPVAERMVKELSTALPAGSLAEGRYLWSLTPFDNKKAALQGSKMNRLELSYDNAVLNLRVASPLNNELVGATAAIRGIAPVGSKLSVNGKAVRLDDKARFDDRATPVGGLLIFRINKGGADTFTVRRVRRA